MKHWIGYVVACAIALGSVMLVAAQEALPRPVVDVSLVGNDSFRLYCASCHGTGGSGDGPVSAALRTKPADLRRLTIDNQGAYPREEVLGFITGTGRAPAAHGTTEMPIWGPMFRTFESDARTRVRLENLVLYIERLQLPSSGPDAPGAQAFRTYCASCHGASAQGDGVMVGELNRRPPDLTQYTLRNGGVFPEEKLRRIVDGRGVRAHGTMEMPVWGDAFRRNGSGLTNQETDARIRAILRYLEAVQQRGA